MNKNPKDMLIFALDTGSHIKEAISWVDRLKEHVGSFKIGKESFTFHGPGLVRRVKAKGCRVFLDLKFHDIPQTVAAAAVAAVKLGVDMFNIHAVGGGEMMESAVVSTRWAAQQSNLPMPLVLAVTVLTSLDDDDLKTMGFHRSASDLTLDLAKIAQDAGVGGVVASARDVEGIRKACGRNFVIVTPGIRGKEMAGDDQKRIWTARDAVASGADYIVIGRPIRTAVDPVNRADEIVLEIAEGLAIIEKNG